MLFYYAFGLFKTAVIVQQIYYRYVQGFTKDERFASSIARCWPWPRKRSGRFRKGRFEFALAANAVHSCCSWAWHCR